MKKLKKAKRVAPNLKESAEKFEKHEGKQIVGFARIKRAGEQAVNCYTLEDGKEVFLKDDNSKTTKKAFNKVKRKKWPKEIEVQ